MGGYKDEYLVIEKKLNAANEQFESAKNEFAKQCDADKEELENIKHEYSLLSLEFGKKSEELKLVATYTRALEAKHKDLETNLDTLKLQNEILEAVKDEHAMLSDQLKQTEQELETANAENIKLRQKSVECDALNVKYNAMTKQMEETQTKMDDLQKEFAI